MGELSSNKYLQLTQLNYQYQPSESQNTHKSAIASAEQVHCQILTPSKQMQTVQQKLTITVRKQNGIQRVQQYLLECLPTTQHIKTNIILSQIMLQMKANKKMCSFNEELLSLIGAHPREQSDFGHQQPNSNPNSIVIKQWIHKQSFYYSHFQMSQNTIKAKQQSAFVFGEAPIQANFQFSFKMGRTVGTTIIGIIDSSFPNAPNLINFRNRKYLYESTGHAHTGQTRRHQLKKFKENDEVKVLGNLKEGKIIWKINGSEQLSCQCQLLQEQSTKWCLFLYLSFKNSLQMISAIPSFQVATIHLALGIFEWDQDILHDVFEIIAKSGEPSPEEILF